MINRQNTQTTKKDTQSHFSTDNQTKKSTFRNKVHSTSGHRVPIDKMEKVVRKAGPELQLKYLSNKTLCNFEPTKYCRVIDLIFLIGRLDSQKCKVNNCEEYFRPFFSIINFKRINKIIITDELQQNIWYSVEERWINNNNESLKNFATVIDHLFANGIDKEQKFSQLLIFWVNSITNLNTKIHINQVNVTKNGDINNDFDNLNQIILTDKESLKLQGRLYYQRLDTKTIKDIKTKPFFLIHQDLSDKNLESCIKWLCCNSLFLELTRQLNSTTTGSDEGFEAFSVIYTMDWLSLYEKYINFIMDLKQHCMI